MMIEVASFQVKVAMRVGVDCPAWLGYPIINGEILWIRFEGSTQDEVIKKANDWYDGERIVGRHELHGDEVSSKPYKNEWGGPVGGGMADGGWGNINEEYGKLASPNSPGIPHALSGSVWLIHHSQRKKGRFPASEVAAMLAQGWEKAGPRTVFREEVKW